MAIDQTNASIFARRKKANAGKSTTKFDYPIQDPGTRVFQLKGFTLFKDENYGKEQYGNMKVKMTAILLGDGDPENADDHESLREQAYGKWFSRDEHPVATPPGVNPRTSEKYRASGLYEIIRHLACFGRQPDPFTLLGIVDEDDDEQMAALRAWVKEYNADKDPEDRITDQDTAMAQYAAAAVTRTLNELETAEPPIQFEGTLDIKTSGAGNEYNKLTGITRRLRDKDMLPLFKSLPKPLDPRTANDDPDIICDVCGQPTHGYLRRTDDVWVDNREAAKMSREQNGLVACGSCIWKHSASNPDNHGKQVPFEGAKPVAKKPAVAPAKPAKPAAKPAPARNVPQTVDEDDDLPF